MPKTGDALPTAHYTVGPEGSTVRNIGEKGSDRVRTAQNARSGWLKRHKRTLPKYPKYLNLHERDVLFRVIADPRDRAIFRLACHHGLRASEVGMIQMKDWSGETSLDVDRLFLHRLKGSIGGETNLVNAAATAFARVAANSGHFTGADLHLTEPPSDLATVHGRIDEALLHARWHPQRESPLPRPKTHLRDAAAFGTARKHRGHPQKHLGHDIQKTMIYAQLTAQANRARVESLRDWRVEPLRDWR